VNGAVPGLAVRVGRGPAVTWSLVLRVRGEGGVSRRGFEKKGRRYRLTLGSYPALRLEAARARANEARLHLGQMPDLKHRTVAVAVKKTRSREAKVARLVIRSRAHAPRVRQTISAHLGANARQRRLDDDGVLAREKTPARMQRAGGRVSRPAPFSG
jgi:hypothetical protein